MIRTPDWRFGRLGTLLDWHRQHAVSDAERRRNGLLFTEYQGNRNPFVDDPDFADRIFSGAPPPTGLNVMLCRPVLALDDGPAALTGVVALSGPAVADTVVTLETDITLPGLSVPASVTVGTGESSAVFTVDATAAGVPSFGAFRESWTLTASAADFGTDDAGVTLLGAGGRGWETFDRLLLNGISRGSSPTFGSASGASDTVLTYVLDDLQVEGDFTLEIRNVSGRQLVVDDIRWTGWPAGDLPAPELAAFPDRLALPGYIGDTGPGEEVRLRVFGTRLGSGPLIAEAPAGFEIAFDDEAFATTLNLPEPVDGLTAVFLRARLQDGLSPGLYSGPLVVNGGGAGPLEIALSGSVADSASVTLPGLLAGGYQQDFSGFAATGELPFGWQVTADGSASNRHDITAWGTTATGIKRGSTADPLLGYQHTADTGNTVMRVDLENRSGQMVRALDIQYTARTERLTLTRDPEFETRVNGGLRSALAYSTTEGDGILKRERFGGLAIPPGDAVLSPFDYLMRITCGLPDEAAAPDANPSGDGVVNLMKFALGGDPLVADRSVLPELVFPDDNRPALRFHTGPELAWDAETSVLAGSGLEISLQRSSDMVGWIPVPADLLDSPLTNPLPAGTGIIIGPQSVPETGPLFLRLKVRLTDD